MAAEWLKSSYRQAKKAVLDMSEEEMLVEEATNEEPWGPHGQVMSKIAEATQSDMDKFSDIMTTLWRRIAEGAKAGGSGERWRRAYKGLLLVDHLLKHGSTRCVDEIARNSHVIEQLTRFKFVDDKQRDQGINVREKAKRLGDLLQDTERLKSERLKARENKAKFSGLSSEDYRTGGFGSGGYARPASSADGGRIASQGFGSTDDDAILARRAPAAPKGAEDDEALSAYRAEMAAKRAGQAPRAHAAAPPAAAAAPPAAPLPDLMGGFGGDSAPAAVSTTQADAFNAFESAPAAAAVPTLAPPRAAPAAAAAAQSTASDNWAAFGAMPASAAPAPAPAADLFAAAELAPAADPFSALAAAPAGAPAAGASTGLEDLFGGLSASGAPANAAPAPTAAKAPPLNAGLFGGAAPAATMAPDGGFDGFGGFTGATPAAQAPAQQQPTFGGMGGGMGGFGAFSSGAAAQAPPMGGVGGAAIGGMTAAPINIAQRQGSSGSSFGVMGSPSKPKGAGGNLSAAGVVGGLTPKGGLEEDFAELSGMWGNK